MASLGRMGSMLNANSRIMESAKLEDVLRTMLRTSVYVVTHVPCNS